MKIKFTLSSVALLTVAVAAIAEEGKPTQRIPIKLPSSNEKASVMDWKGKEIPFFSMTDLQGNVMTKDSLKGKVVLLDFWATWCPPCKKASPTMQKLHDAYKDKGLVVIGANVSQREEDKVKPARDYATEHGYSYAITTQNDEFKRQLGIGGIPTFVLINRSGIVEFVQVGFGSTTEGVLKDAVEKMLASNKIPGAPVERKPQQPGKANLDQLRTLGGALTGKTAPKSTKPRPKLPPMPKEGEMMPLFKVVDMDGKLITNDSLKGKPYVIDFWATWCGPCKKASPTVQMLHDKYSKQGLVVFGANTEKDYSKPLNYAKEHNYTYTMIPNAGAWSRRMGVTGIPTFFFVDANGRIAKVLVGFLDSRVPEMEAIVQSLVK